MSACEYQKNSWVARAVSQVVPRLELSDLLQIAAVGTIKGMSHLDIQKLTVKHYNTLVLASTGNRYGPPGQLGESR